MTRHTSKIAEERTEVGLDEPAAPAERPGDDFLVARAQSGDMDAFGELIDRYQDRIYGLVLRMTGRHADAEELAQETFLKALEKIGQFRGTSQFYTWLFRIAANLTLSYRRRATKVKFHPMASDDGNLDDAVAAMAARTRPGEPAPDAAALSAETGSRVLGALDELDADYRLVLVLRDMEDMDYAAIGKVLDLPVGTVKSKLHRARCMLRGKLSDLVD